MAAQCSVHGPEWPIGRNSRLLVQQIDMEAAMTRSFSPSCRTGVCAWVAFGSCTRRTCVSVSVFGAKYLGNSNYGR